MLRQELADAVNAHLQAFGVRLTVNACYVGRLERGDHRWPGAAYREAFRAVFGVATDAELGFFITRRTADDLSGPDEHESGVVPAKSGDGESVKVPADFWDRPDVLDVLRGRDLGGLFRLLRRHCEVDERWIASAVGLTQERVADLVRGTCDIETLSTLERIADGLVMPDHARIALGIAPSLPGSASVRRDEQVMSLHVEPGASVTVVALDCPAVVTVAAPRVQVGDPSDFMGDDSDIGSVRRRIARLVGQLRDAGWSWVQIAEVVRERFGVNPRVALRLAHGWTQQQVADEWNWRWPDEPKTHKALSRWEVWPAESGHAPPFDVLARLAELYRCAIADLVADLADFRHLDHAGTDKQGSGDGGV